ncbi:DUF1080 domain-containing protein [Paraglaciecola aquimarina]|uniref:DUF1080 domain-containing protein n=1 Tax=Paraglaciecola aquimarina TaxID=1235557 RepID=A0ABU3STT1_9ALTE|nr:DUF1080 domain-containing protein [Paraglaciecola aquimarina]MDU0353409.1 DUF1080 domain-containing protein [Paraglaciecola aquimarina]
MTKKIAITQLFGLSCTLFIPIFSQAKQAQPEDTEIWQPVPKQVNPYPIPADAKILFAGENLERWVDEQGKTPSWKVMNGEFHHSGKSKKIFSKDKFCNMQLHVEWRTPEVDQSREGQRRGNSGIKIQNRYEIQILDSYNNPTYVNGQAASIYKQSAPLVNASLPPLTWQSYDIIYQAPSFDTSGEVTSKAYVTVLHNGVLVQNHVELAGSTAFIGQPKYKQHGCDSIQIQFHGSKVSFRNIWLREL